MLLTHKNIDVLFSKTKFYLVFVIVFFVGLCVSACSKQQIIVPKVTPEPTNLRLTGKFVWFDLFTHDLQSASRFYEELFGESYPKKMESEGEDDVNIFYRLEDIIPKTATSR